ncbi:formyltetrahydrofolate deformylase [Aeromicrobium sp. SMF47]|uniref:Formyltetrahydrofolate deformylase n=1 Tax=Aeromicrobium yanjiei TaxID=2662028 RepID=A0A5Q2MKJ0_9ACTN|nr:MULTISPECIES: formyltetrahydrofolate deformylase [Aeromicrobium]MRJ75062.1 formyltetrahydrofolate deformylase [Aeromicrobium yanjiei]MRK02882.1 formyltetrahydrofolate deformylase [Aeromicrobium sp. S22]QGG40450.1 formyltetrahydrofolate deformylase [Aeromicrobium yanjiei]
MPSSFVLTLSCPDRPGLVFAVTRWIAESGGNILDSQQFTDVTSGPDSAAEFFLRVHFDVPEPRDVATVSQQFAPVAAEHRMTYRLVPAERPLRALVMVSREGHCLNDLLYRQSTGALHVEIPAIVSNHRDLERLAAAYDVPFTHVPVTPDTKQDAEAALLAMVDELDIDLVVLARYMQILSDDLCRALEGRAINIHHSFLPSFKGARPYQQAHDRGVKLIGATAHYVTAALDEGPIIDQGVLRVDHRMTAADLARVGRDVESQTLSRAVQLHAESRVLMNGPRTVVFD